MSSSQSLPQELLVEILSWVPVKDLMRFKCISKWLYSFVDDPTFVKLHLQRSPINTLTLLTFMKNVNNEFRYYATPCSISALIENPLSTIDACPALNHACRVMGICNGLVCLINSCFTKSLDEVWFTNKFWFFNPATRISSKHVKPITRISSKLANHSEFVNPIIGISSEGLPYIRVSSSCFGTFRFGFGYDDCTDTYKLVSVFLDSKLEQINIRIYYIGDNCWRSALTCPFSSILRISTGVFVSGTLNWLALHKFNTVTIDDIAIFSFHLKNETYKYLSMPRDLIEVTHYHLELKVTNGCLCLSHHGRIHFGLWVIREFGVENSWTHLVNISYNQFHFCDSPSRLFIEVLCMSGKDDVLFLVNYKGCQGQASVYNKKGNKIECCGDFNNDKSSFLSYDYIQSLVFPY